MKDRIKWFDDFYPCMQIECSFLPVYNWKQFFVSVYIDTIANNNNDFELLEEMNTILLTEPLDALVLYNP
ncbi:MAG: hypothetical protein ACXWEW_08890 [Nitrososphaeraceae archaeon]